MIPSPLKRPGVMKCPACRLDRQKCIPSDPDIAERVWLAGGQQDKCARCNKLGHACGPPEYPSSSEQVEVQPQSTVPRKRRVSEVHNLVPDACNVPPSHITAAMTGPSRILSDYNVTLQCRLREIDLRLDAKTKIEEDILSIDVMSDDHENQKRFDPLIEAKDATIAKLLSLLRLTKDLAIGMQESGHEHEAYMAYARIVETYYKLDMPASYEIRAMLIKMSKILWTTGDDYRAQSLAWQALNSHDRLRQAQHSDLDVLKHIVRSLLRTTPELSEVIQSEIPSPVLCKCNTLLPPLHAMMQNNYAFQVRGNIFQSGLHPDINNPKSPESPIVGGIDAVVNFLEVCSDTELSVRDSKKRSALFLAASLCKEGLGLGLVARAKHDSRVLKQVVNARDESGQTVLSVTITSGCSLPFITALIDNGAEVEPGTMPRANTPLQAACYIGSFEIVDLLVARGANVHTAFIGSTTPIDIAHELGHFEIFELLSKFSSKSPAFYKAAERDHG